MLISKKQTLETPDFQGFFMVATGLEPVTISEVPLSVHWALMRAIFALTIFICILYRPERTFPHPSTLGFFLRTLGSGFHCATTSQTLLLSTARPWLGLKL
jgi:hypothetical protein